MPGKDDRRSPGLALTGLWLLLCLCTGPAWSVPLVLLSEDSAIYREVGTAIADSYGLPVEQRDASVQIEREPLDAELVVAVGANACEQLLQRDQPAFSLICAFIPRATFVALTQRYGDSPLALQRRLTAIYLDQPLQRQLRLAHLLVPDASSIGAMFGPASATERGLFVQAAEAEGLSPVTLTLEEQDNPLEKLQPVVRQSDIFLALPDRALFNRATAKWLLYVTLQQQIPLIGFLRTYVEAGALSAVYTTPAQVGRQAGELLRSVAAGEAMTTPSFPRYFTVTSNPVVARNLNLQFPDDATLQRMLSEEESL